LREDDGMPEYTKHPLISPAVLDRMKKEASGGIVAFRPDGSPDYLVYGDDAVLFFLMFGVPPGCYFRIDDEPSVYAVPAAMMDGMARRAHLLTKNVVRVHGVRRGCDPDWFV
jgi:hypothetical protein